MRVSDKLIYNQIANSLQKNAERLLRIQNGLSSGKKIESPSDDPIGNGGILNYASLLNKAEQYGRNMDDGLGTLTLNDSTLSQVTQVLGRAKELAVQLRSDTNSAADRAAAAKEIRQLLRQVVELGNTRDGDDYLYSGYTVRGQYLGQPVTLPLTVTAGSNDTLQVKVDGVTSGTVTLTAGAYATGGALAAEIQTRINADATLGTKDVTVSYDSIANRLVIASQGYGENSSVDVLGGSARALLGLTGGTSSQGDRPFTLSTVTATGARNTGTGAINSGTVSDENRTTLDDYLIKFTSASQYDLYRISTTATAASTGPTASNAVVSSAAVINPGALTLDNYEIRFTGATTYDMVDTTKGITISSGNTYTSGANIDTDGLRVVIADGSAGGPKNGDIFTLGTNGVLVSAGNSYTSGTPMAFEGLSATVSGPVAANDAFTVRTKYVFNGDLNDRRVTIGENTTAPVGMSGGKLFSGAQGGTDLLAVLKDFYNSLAGNNTDGLDTALRQVDLALNQVIATQAEVGGRVNYLETTKQNMEAFKLHLTSLKSGLEDIDLTKAASDLVLQENVLQAARATAARVIQPSLLDFLK